MKNGDVLIKHDYIEGDEKTVWINYTYRRTTRQFEGFEDVLLGKIIKIEEPTYTTEYKAKTEILGEKEKEYLSNVIRPFRNKVINIEKMFYDGKEYITIKIKSAYPDDIDLPSFKVNTMYKGMEVDKEYTLEELGL